MLVAFLLLLIASPVQAADDTTSVQHLKKRVEELETRLEMVEEREDIRRGYYLDTIEGERAAYAAFLTLIVALFGAVGYGYFQKRIRDLKEDIERRRDEEIGEVSEDVEELRNGVAESIQKIMGDVRGLENSLYEELSDIYGKMTAGIGLNEEEIDVPSPLERKIKAIKYKKKSYDGENFAEDELMDLEIINIKAIIDSFSDDAFITKEKYEKVRKDLKQIRRWVDDESEGDINKALAKWKDIYEGTMP